MLFFTLVGVSFTRSVLKTGQLLYTKISLNYRIETLFDGDKEVSSTYFDVHSKRKIKNPTLIKIEAITQERWEDLENLMVVKYDLDGKVISQKSYKKNDTTKSEIRLNEEEIEAMEKYDVEDEELTIKKVNWDRVIFADENFIKEFVVRWSQSRNFIIKTEYTRDGLIHKRIVWNRFTGQRIPLDHRVFSQNLEKDIVQNFSGFIEIYYNTLGKVTALRSWDRKSGRTLAPPRTIPFQFRLEREGLQLNFDEHSNFKKDYFREMSDGKKFEWNEGKSLFKDEKKYRLGEQVSFAPSLTSEVRGRVGETGSGSYRKKSISSFGVDVKWRPGKYRVYTELDHMSYSDRINGDFLLKNTRYLFGADLKARITHVDNFVKKKIFSRYDSEINILGGLRTSVLDLKFKDGSRKSSYSEMTLQPIFGYELAYFPREKSKLSLQFLGTSFHLGGVNTKGIRTKVEYLQKLPISMNKIFKNLDVGIGYIRHDYQLKTDTDTLNEVQFGADYKGTYLKLSSHF